MTNDQIKGGSAFQITVLRFNDLSEHLTKHSLNIVHNIRSSAIICVNILKEFQVGRNSVASE